MVHSCITIEYNSLQSFRTVYERLGARKMEIPEIMEIRRKSFIFSENGERRRLSSPSVVCSLAACQQLLVRSIPAARPLAGALGDVSDRSVLDRPDFFAN